LVKRGEVWWGEHHEAGRRPFLVLTRTSVITYLNAVTVAALTRTIRDLPTEVLLEPERHTVPQRSVVNLDSVHRVPKAALTSRICTLDGATMHEVCRALNLALGC
jgi:mRNA interferase MazF